MGPSSRRALLLQGAGLVGYLVGMVLFFVVVIEAFLAEPQNSFRNLTGGYLPYLLVSVALIVAGRLISWKFGGKFGLRGYAAAAKNPGPDQSTLEQLGYQLPPEEGDRGESKYTYEDGETYVVCRECGARNERGFSYCHDCSAQLPESET